MRVWRYLRSGPGWRKPRPAFWCRARRIAAGLGAGLAALCAALMLWPMDVEHYLAVEDASCEIFDRAGTPIYAFLDGEEQWSFPRRYGEISPHLVHATIAAEDQRFLRHLGVDPLAIARAAWQNLARRRIYSGASTITMQLVKLADHLPRSFAHKLYQAAQAIRLDLRSDKASIVAAYLNRAPYGLNLLGCEAAARRYFGKPARELTLAEAALLAGLPKAPSYFLPIKHPERARARREYVLRRMRDDGFITAEEYARAAAASLGAAWHPFPQLAPHLAMDLHAAAPRARAIRTTIDAGLQRYTERELAAWIAGLKPSITNGAVMIVDTPAAAVLARVGAADFFDTAAAGQVDACRARRSPGSTLKPFIYALAMERNVLYPSEMLLDGALDFGRYNPRNFLDEYQGLISATDALRRSLNIPAVIALNRAGIADLQALLRRAGLTTLTRAPAEYGLGLTLGNCETRLDEMAAAYSGLARLGEYRPLRVSTAEAEPAATRVLSRGTCLALYQMLEQPLPGELDPGAARRIDPPRRLCWKTGTSAGHRDAWAFVFNAQHLVAVWIGNSDGSAALGLVGAQAALPLAGRLFRHLKPSSAPSWPEPAGDLRRIETCALTGLPPSRWCPRNCEVVIPRGQYTHRICDVHHPAPDAGQAGSETGSERVVERWPARARDWDLARVGRAREGAAPATEAESRRRETLRILDPVERAEYILTGEDGADRIRLRASLDRQLTLYWYLDRTFLGTSTPDAPLFIDLSIGVHTLACMSLDGRSDRARFEVLDPAAMLLGSQP